MEIRTEIVSVTPAGVAGSAAGSATTEKLSGWLLDIYLDYEYQPVTTDVTIAYAETADNKGNAIPSLGTILAVGNANTDGLFAPRQDEVDDAGTGLTTKGYFPLNSPLTVSVAQGDPFAAGLKAYIRYIQV